MVKATVNKKVQTKKKAKASQIIAQRAYTPTAIKQKVVINLDKGVTKRGRGRPRKGSERRGPVAPGPTFLKTSMEPQHQFYNQLRASIPYVEEIKDEVKRLKEDKQSNEKNLLGMQQQALLMQMYNQQQPNDSYKSYTPLASTAYIEEIDDDEDEDVVDAKIAANQARLEAEKKALEFQTKQLSKKEQTLLNKQEGARKAREARAKLSEADKFAENKLLKNTFEAMKKSTSESKVRKVKDEALKEAMEEVKRREREAIRKANEQERLAKAKAKAEAQAKAKAKAEAKEKAEDEALAKSIEESKKQSGIGAGTTKKKKRGGKK